MKTSESIVNISKALLVAQKNMGGAVKDSKNPFFKSSYSDYNSVLAVVKDPLNAAGIFLTQPTIVRDGKTLVETTVIHADSGEYITGELEVVTTKDRDPQSYGSAITYARRYSLQSMLSIPAVDDDAEASMYRGQAATVTTISAVGTATSVGPVSDSGAITMTPTSESIPAPAKKPSGFRRVGSTAPVTAAAPVAPSAPTEEGIEF